MANQKMDTAFATAAKASDEILQKQHKLFADKDFLKTISDSVPDIMLILNYGRQIVCANKILLDILALDSIQEILGKRPGEALNCIHAFKTEGGCGTTEFCKTCGAVQAILACQSGKADVKECRIIQKDTGDALDFRIWATPIEVEGEQFTIFAAKDISHEKRRRALERIFFHDVLNTAGGLHGFAQMLSQMHADEPDEMVDSMYHISETLIDEIQSQKALMSAENNDLKVNITDIPVKTLLERLSETYRNHLVAEEKTIEIDPGSEEIMIKSDIALIKRVVGNMLKNALEASQCDETVKIGCIRNSDKIKFYVKNPAYIPRDSQLQIFQRSFSTKGLGRGLGTYSMKLLSERYLGGKVGFTSDEKEGTTFFGEYPLELKV